MNDIQNTIGSQSRWIVKETYEGRFDSTYTICACVSITDAALICEACCKFFSGRPFTFIAVHIADDFDPDFDSLVRRDILGDVIDYTKYTEGVSAL